VQERDSAREELERLGGAERKQSGSETRARAASSVHAARQGGPDAVELAVEPPALLEEQRRPIELSTTMDAPTPVLTQSRSIIAHTDQ
jgi:hypothetical protein